MQLESPPLRPLTARESLATFHALTDRQVTTTLATITMFGHAAIARLVAILAEFDERQLHRPLGFTSLFAYCTTQLGFSQDEAFYRIKAARAARRFPAILDYLEKGALNLTSLRLLVPHLTSENHAGLLETASRKKLTDVELLIARLKPRADIPSSIRKLPPISGKGLVEPSPSADAQHTLRGSARAAAVPGQPSRSVEPSATEAPRALPTFPIGASDVPPSSVSRTIQARRAIVQPLSDVSYRLQITLTKESHDTLRLIQALIRHRIPSGDPAVIVARGLDLLLTDLRKKRTAEVARPMPPRSGTPRGRRIPAHVQRAVWTRDGGQCGFVSKDGRRCDAGEFLELHHVKPYARGGKATAANLQLRCRAHNQYEAEIAGLKRRP